MPVLGQIQFVCSAAQRAARTGDPSGTAAKQPPQLGRRSSESARFAAALLQTAVYYKNNSQRKPITGKSAGFKRVTNLKFYLGFKNGADPPFFASVFATVYHPCRAKSVKTFAVTYDGFCNKKIPGQDCRVAALLAMTRWYSHCEAPSGAAAIPFSPSVRWRGQLPRGGSLISRAHALPSMP